VGKRIIVLSDSTGNSSGKAEKTNIWRTFQSIDQSLGAQLAMYDDGVGTSSNKYLAAIGGAVGVGLKRNVIDLYKFLCRNYVHSDGKTSPDEIFGFGFSRGAFTIRTLTDFVLQQGIVDYRSEEELHLNALRAYSNYRNSCFKPTLRLISPVSLFRTLRHGIGSILDKIFHRPPLTKRVRAEDMQIRFLGLWDTVSAYGMPIEEFRPVVNFLFWPMLWDDLFLSTRVTRACHALALDDERTTFHPIVWDERHEEKLISECLVPSNRLTQIWFAGVHSNLGGGYPEDQLSLVSLDWMLSQARDAGLVLLDTSIELVRENKSAYARLYDSRAGFGGFYRYSPRVIQTYDNPGTPIWPVIHHSAIMRMAYGSDAYAPLPLPAQFQVLAPDGSLIAFSATGSLPCKRTGPSTPQMLQVGEIDERMNLLQAALYFISQPNMEALSLAKDTVWWRRLNYFVTLGLTFIIVSLPWTSGLYSEKGNETDSSIQNAWADSALGIIITTAQTYSPHFFQLWTDSFKKVPFLFCILAIGLIFSLWMSSLLSGRIRDRSQYAWHSCIAKNYEDWVRVRINVVFRVSIVTFTGFLLATIWQIFKSLTENETNSRLLFHWELAFLLGVGSLISVFSMKRNRSITRQLEVDEGLNDLKNLPSTWSLSMARRVRTQPTLVAGYRWISRVGVPVLLGIILIMGIFVTANRVVFEAANVSGYGCSRTKGPLANAPISGIEIPIDKVCSSTGVKLIADQTYRITLTDPKGELFDQTVHSDLGGFEGASLKHRTAKLLRRKWNENWLTPIARVGEHGNEEYALHPEIPYAPLMKPYLKLPEKSLECEDSAKIDDLCGSFAKPNAKAVDALTLDDPTPLSRRTLTAYIHPKHDGELFLFVNDAIVLLIPILGTHFYDNNFGNIYVKVERVIPTIADETH